MIAPYEKFKVSVYQKSQAEKDDMVFITDTITDSKGKYEILLESIGDYIVVFTEEKQHKISTTASWTFTIDEIIECKVEDNNNGNNENGDNGNSDSGNEDWCEIGDSEIMQIDAITSIVINQHGITYNMHTDGYYKKTVNFIGSLGISKEDWEDNVTKDVLFYNNSKCNNVSSQNPF